MNVMLPLGMLVKSDSLVTKSLGPLKYRKMALLTYSNYSPQNPIPGKFLKPPGMCSICFATVYLPLPLVYSPYISLIFTVNVGKYTIYIYMDAMG